MLWNETTTLTDEPRRVTLSKGGWVDEKRAGRIVPYKIYIPDALAGDPERFPVVVWSHGLGGTRDGAGFISRYVAAHGYVVVHVQHIGTDSVLWEGMPGHPWDNIRKAHIIRKTSLARYRDIPFALKSLRAMPADQTARMDLTNMGMSGHSLGALTTQLMAGQRVVRRNRHYELYQPDFKAGILYSPVPARRDPRDPGFVYGGIRIPLLHMTGTDDQSPIKGFGVDKRVEVYTHANGADQMLLMIENGDHMVFNGSRGGLAANPQRDRQEEMIKVISLAWWDWYLKNDMAAYDWLHGIGIKNFIGRDATIDEK